MKINFDKYVFNDAFYPLFYDDSRILALKGGAGSSKSWSIAQKFVMRTLEESNNRFLLSRKTGRTIRNSQFKLIKDIVNMWGLNDYFTFRETDLAIRCDLTNTEFISVGADDREKMKSLAGITSMWLEEVTEFDEKDYRQLSLRMRGGLPEGAKYKQLVVTFNPIDESHWIRNELFPLQVDQLLLERYEKRQKKRKKLNSDWIDFDFRDVAVRYERKVNVGTEVATRNITVHHSTYEDNRFMDLHDKAELEDLKSKDINYWQVYAKGMWGSIGNLVFNPAWKVLDAFPLEYDEVFYGLDFGYFHPSALVQVGVRDGAYYVKELLYEKRLTNSELIEMIRKENLISTEGEVYCDNAEPDRINEFRQAEFNVRPAYKGSNSVKDSIDYLKSIRIFSHIDNHNLNRELKTFKWKEDTGGNPIEGQVVPLNDDLIAATRYAIWTHSRMSDIKIAFIKRQ